MGETTGIEWTDATFNPWISCTKVHTGCTNCYAEQLATTRLGRLWGKGAPRQVTSDSNWKLPGRWARAAAKEGERRRVFCASMADVLDEEAPVEAQQRLWQLIRETAYPVDQLADRAIDGHPWLDHLGRPFRPGLDWQVLTKRPERWELIPEDVRPLMWFGTSISDQATADKWVPRLLATKGFRYRFLSVEPLLSRVDLDQWLSIGIDWMIVGGESGAGARPMPAEAVDSLRAQAEHAGVPLFFKQWGHWKNNPLVAEARALGRKPDEYIAEKDPIGKGGSMIDGIAYKAFPQSAAR